jgi:3-methyladenine DNA glycosylase AlkD
MESDIIFAISQELIQSSDEKTRDGARRFFKEEVKFHGVKAAAVRRIAAKHWKELSGKDKREVFSLCEQLLQSNYGEEAFIAFEWAARLHKMYEPSDFRMFEGWIVSYVDNWAKCDTLCNHAIGSFVEMYPEFIKNLYDWARSDNRWLRRAAAVTLILPARKGEFLDEVFAISDILLKDGDDLVQKGYGWMLKEASKAHQSSVFDYVMRRKSEMPRTALRYAIEKMPSEMRQEAMKR